MATTDTNAHHSSILEQLPPAIRIQTAETNAIFMDEQVSLQGHPLFHRQGQIVEPPSYVCEWMPTSLRLPSQDAQQGDIYLCLPVHLSEASYFKQNEEKEECKDDGYCSITASQLRLSELDRYLAAAAPLSLSTQKLLFGAPDTRNYDCDHQVHRNTFRKIMGQLGRSQLRLAKQPRSSSYHRLVTSTNSGRVINVLQGELAHCTPFQADLLVSDDATTCHILALWSRWSGSDEGENMNERTSRNCVLGTMTHIDGPGYEDSIRDAVNEHVKYHSIHLKQSDNEECKENCANQMDVGSGIIDMSIHIMGGFNDHEGNSIEITDSILQTFSALSNECNAYSIRRRAPRVCMTLETCAVASANDNGTGCPLGRGLAMEVATGNVFLAEIEDCNLHGTLSRAPSNASCDEIGMVAADGDFRLCNRNSNASFISAQGPGVTLRSVRLWASAFHSRGQKQESGLNVIHRPDRDYLCVQPFFFGPHSAAKGLLDCSNEELLQLTSTSPDVEKYNFVSKVRDSLNFMNGTTSVRVFPGGRPIIFQRVDLNGWIRTS